MSIIASEIMLELNIPFQSELPLLLQIMCSSDMIYWVITEMYNKIYHPMALYLPSCIIVISWYSSLFSHMIIHSGEICDCQSSCKILRQFFTLVTCLDILQRWIFLLILLVEHKWFLFLLVLSACSYDHCLYTASWAGCNLPLRQ